MEIHHLEVVITHMHIHTCALMWPYACRCAWLRFFRNTSFELNFRCSLTSIFRLLLVFVNFYSLPSVTSACYCLTSAVSQRYLNSLQFLFHFSFFVIFAAKVMQTVSHSIAQLLSMTNISGCKALLVNIYKNSGAKLKELRKLSKQIEDC